METVIAIIIFFLCLLLLLPVALAAISFAPFVPCRKKDLARIFKLANLQTGETFYDLGCGDGRTVLYAGKNYQAKAIGVEMAWPLFFFCNIKKLFLRNNRISFKWKDLFRENLGQADVVFMFGMPEVLKNKITKKLKAEMRPGARVISYVFAIKDWEPEIIDKPTANDVSVYLYKI